MKILVYMPIGSALDMFITATNALIERSGLEYGKEWDFLAVLWNPNKEVREYVKEKNFMWIEVNKNSQRDYLWQLYESWNAGYSYAFNFGGYDGVVPTGSDHFYYKDFLKNLVKYASDDRIVNCQLIERGVKPSLHVMKDFGLPTKDFPVKEFDDFCANIFEDKLVMEQEAGRRLDAMPMCVPRAIWEKFGPMPRVMVDNVTGDTFLFNMARNAGIKIVQSKGAISYHSQGSETARNWGVK